MNRGFRLMFPSPRQCVCQAGKGFGSPKPAKKSSKVNKKGGKNFNQPETSVAQQSWSGLPQLPKTVEEESLEERMNAREEELLFSARLAALKAEAAQKQAELVQRAAPAGNVLESELYTQPPPPLTQTLLGDKPDDTGAGGNKVAQIGAAVFALLLVGVIVVTSAPLELPVASSVQQAAKQAALTAEQKRGLQKQLGEFLAVLKEDPQNEEALEGAAVLYGTLGQFKEAEEKLAVLCNVRPQDPEVWRVLGEARLQLKKSSAAVSAYRTALAVSPSSPAPQEASSDTFELLQGLVTALVADRRPGQAVDEVQAALRAAEAEVGSTDKAVELRLLLGKTLSQWRGHGADALAVYEALIKAYPQDFRGYLAKGVLLKSQKKQGDAERMFLQARYLAPPELRPTVDRLIGR